MPLRYYIKSCPEYKQITFLEWLLNQWHWNNQEKVKPLIRKMIDGKMFKPQVSLQFLRVWSGPSYSARAAWVLYLWDLQHPLLTPHQSEIRKDKQSIAWFPKSFLKITAYLLGWLTCINNNKHTVSIHGSIAHILHHHWIQLVHFLFNNTRGVIKYHLQAKA